MARSSFSRSRGARGPRLAAAVLAALLLGLFGGCGLSTYGTGEPSGATPCGADGQCDDGNPCTVDTCSAEGACQVAPAPDGDVPVQVPGDCHTDTCVGGALTTVVNDGDVLDDGNDCTSDSCGGGEVHNTTKPDDTACVVGEAQGFCQAGACAVACGAGLPPCQDQNPCTTDVCDVALGQCAYLPLDGVEIPGYVDPPEDCGLWRCVAGNPSKIADPEDKPVTPANDCDLELCYGTLPLNPLREQGAACVTNGGRVCDGAGLCVECNAPSDCVDLPLDNECRQRTCTGNACGLTLLPANTPIPLQTAGDCKTVVCQADGELTEIAAPADLPNDNEECTIDTCAGDTPTHTPKGLNTPCGAMMDLYCNAVGACVGCTAVEQCPASDFCKTRTCNAQQCGYDFTAAGTALPPTDQTTGDCKELQCDGAGNVMIVAKSTDVFVDGNQCTTDVCTGSTPSNPPSAPNTACTQGGAWCDGAGTCVECNLASQCPGATACVLATCDPTLHTCGTTNVPQGTALPSGQTTGDCKRLECDGSGGIQNAPFPSDLPNDSNQCTVDTCNGPTPTFTNAPLGATCTQNGGQQCDGFGVCKRVNGTGCTDLAQCLSGNCVDGVCCNTPCTGDCRSCNQASSLGTCAVVTPGTQDTCLAGSLCTAAGECKKVNGQPCTGNGTECQSGVCADGVCCNAPCGGDCRACNLAGASNGTCTLLPVNTVDTCGANMACDAAGTCKKVNGQTCAAGECVSGNCVDGVCCNSTCTATCFACNVSGSAGTCTQVAPGVQDSCPANQACNVSGQCRADDGQTCMSPNQCYSDQCIDGVCCEDSCVGPCNFCNLAGNLGSCTLVTAGTQGGCAANNVCDAAGVCKKQNGQTCMAPADCYSGFCSPEGVCCNNGCTTTCNTCSTGTCSPVTAGGTDNSCAANQVCNAMQQCKFVNGEDCTSGNQCYSGNCTGTPPNETCQP